MKEFPLYLYRRPTYHESNHSLYFLDREYKEFVFELCSRSELQYFPKLLPHEPITMVISKEKPNKRAWIEIGIVWPDSYNSSLKLLVVNKSGNQYAGAVYPHSRTLFHHAIVWLKILYNQHDLLSTDTLYVSFRQNRKHPSGGSK